MMADVGIEIRDRGSRGVFLRISRPGRPRREKLIGRGEGALDLARERKAELEALLALEDGWSRRAPGDPLPMSDVLPELLARERGLRAFRTQEADAGREKRLLAHFGGEDLRRIDDAAIQQAASRWREQGYSGWTVAGTLSLLRKLWRAARKAGLLTAGPEPDFAGVIRAAKRSDQAEDGGRDAWTLEEMATLLAVAQERDKALVAPLGFLFGTGCRRGEMLGLRWEDVDWQEARVHIRRVPTGRRHMAVETRRPKTGARLVPLAADVLDLLHEHQRARVPAPAFVFSARSRTRMWNEGSFSRRWRRVRDLAALQGVRPLPLHCTRHTAISLWLAAGVPSKRVSEWTGVGLATIERVYAHAIPADVRPPSILPDGGSMGAGGGNDPATWRPGRDLNPRPRAPEAGGRSCASRRLREVKS